MRKKSDSVFPESENGGTDGVRFSEPVFLARSTGKSRIWKAAYRSLKTLETARKPEREAEGEEEGGSENGGKMMWIFTLLSRSNYCGNVVPFTGKG